MTDYAADLRVTTAHPSDRRLIRLTLDLHDGPLQEVAALLGDLKLFRVQLEDSLAPNGYRGRLLGRVDDLEARLVGLDRGLRQLVRNPESPEFFLVPFREAIRDQVDELVLDAGIRAMLSLQGDFQLLTTSQRIALFRVVHEALTNIRRHSGANEAEITIVVDEASDVRAEIWDDGCGFDVERALVRAARDGRLGLVGMAERVRLLGGSLEIDSRPGGPTEISLSLPAWRADEQHEQIVGERG